MPLAGMRRTLARLIGRDEAAADQWGGPLLERHWECPESTRDRFHELGYNRARPFFPHAIRYLPRAGPDGYRLASWMRGTRDPDRLWQVVIHAIPPVLDQVAPDLFEDSELLWHGQHLGLPGHVCYACLVVDGSDAYCTTLVSDLVQRIGRRREHKTRIDILFRGWAHVLWNAILGFATTRGISRVFGPRSRLVVRHTDPARQPGMDLFERVYDRAVNERFVAHPAGDWWVVNVAANRNRIVLPRAIERARVRPTTICIAHDIERGLGHLDSDAEFAQVASRESDRHLDDMLLVEREAGVHTTYSVVGSLLPEVRQRIADGGHALAFHSFDHRLGSRQLARCRAVDYRLPGYRPPQSRLTRELREANLCLHNVEWLAASVHVLGASTPALRHRIVNIPIHLDDYPMYASGTAYRVWERQALDAIDRHGFVALGLHDCYGSWWLPHYRRFLAAIMRRGALRTIDEVAWDVSLASAV